MAQYKAKLSYLRISPRKTRLVADLIRTANVVEAKHQLKFSSKRAGLAMLKLLESAISNAKNQNENLKDENLYISKLTVDEGPKLKRYRPRARGAVGEIHKKTSHITIVLSEREKSQETKNKKQTTSKEQKTKDKVKN